MVAGGNEGALFVWDIVSQQQVLKLQQHAGCNVM